MTAPEEQRGKQRCPMAWAPDPLRQAFGVGPGRQAYLSGTPGVNERPPKTQGQQGLWKLVPGWG